MQCERKKYRKIEEEMYVGRERGGERAYVWSWPRSA
jgi:hypothetical protein